MAFYKNNTAGHPIIIESEKKTALLLVIWKRARTAAVHPPSVGPHSIFAANYVHTYLTDTHRPSTTCNILAILNANPFEFSSGSSFRYRIMLSDGKDGPKSIQNLIGQKYYGKKKKENKKKLFE